MFNYAANSSECLEMENTYNACMYVDTDMCVV